MKLLVRNLSRETTEVEIKSMFEKFGAVQSCSLVIDEKTGLSKGFGFVEMPKQGEAKAAMKTLNGSKLADSVIRVKKASSKQATSIETETEIETSERKSGSKDKLHGVTLEMIVTRLVEEYGWSELGKRIDISCFTHEPSVTSSLKFLRKTAWAREKVEVLFQRLTPSDKASTQTKSKTVQLKPESSRQRQSQNKEVEPSPTLDKDRDKKDKHRLKPEENKKTENEPDNNVAQKKPVKKNPWGTVIEDDD